METKDNLIQEEKNLENLIQIRDNIATVTEQSEYINKQASVLCMAFENTSDDFREISESFVHTAKSMDEVTSHIKEMETKEEEFDEKNILK